MQQFKAVLQLQECTAESWKPPAGILRFNHFAGDSCCFRDLSYCFLHTLIVSAVETEEVVEVEVTQAIEPRDIKQRIDYIIASRITICRCWYVFDGYHYADTIGRRRDRRSKESSSIFPMTDLCDLYA